MGRSKQPLETIALILDVSMKLFSGNGYDKTSMQDIMNGTKLSKGGIYHHFKSKEAIFEAICEKIGLENEIALSKIRDDENLTGYEKLKYIFKESITNVDIHFYTEIFSYMAKNPKFLAMSMEEIQKIVAPVYLLPVLEQGNKDGSLSVENPLQFAEALLVLTNFWVNPVVFPIKNTSDLKKRCALINTFTQAYGIDLLDDETISRLSLLEPEKVEVVRYVLDKEE